jgi:hypothetical protein
VEHDDTGTPRPGEHQDDGSAARLGEMFRTQDGPPPYVVELAKLSFGLRTVDAELAALVADSGVDADAVAVRAGGPDDGSRLLTFEVGEPAGAGQTAAVEVEISGVGRHRRLLGQLHPAVPATIEVRQPAAGPRTVDADDLGRFLVEQMAPGPFSLTCHRPGRRPVVTAWASAD